MADVAGSTSRLTDNVIGVGEHTMNNAFYDIMRYSMGATAVIPALLTLVPFLIVYILGRVRENRLGGSDG